MAWEARSEITSCSTPLPASYRPELDISPELMLTMPIISNQSSECSDGPSKSVVWKLQWKYLCYRLTLLCPVQDTLLVPSISSHISKRNTMPESYLTPCIRSARWEKFHSNPWLDGLLWQCWESYFLKSSNALRQGYRDSLFCRYRSCWRQTVPKISHCRFIIFVNGAPIVKSHIFLVFLDNKLMPVSVLNHPHSLAWGDLLKSCLQKASWDQGNAGLANKI